MATPSRPLTPNRQRVFAERHEIGAAATRLEHTGRGPTLRGGKGSTSRPGGRPAGRKAGSRAK